MDILGDFFLRGLEEPRFAGMRACFKDLNVPEISSEA